MKSGKKKIWHQKVWYKEEVREKAGNRTKPLVCVCLTALFFLTACGEKTDAVDTLVSDQPIGQSADSLADNLVNSDYETAGQITGGKVIAAGSFAMAMNFGETSTQGSILLSIPQQTAGTEILLKDSAGNVLLTYTADKNFDSLVLSCPELTVGETYTVSAGDYEGEVILEELITGNGFGGPGANFFEPD